MKLLALWLLLTPLTGNVSKYLTWKEATHTTKSIPNVPSPAQQEKIRRFGYECFDKIREKAKSPLYVSSLYRNPQINRMVGGAKNSDHQILGDVVACDIDQDGRGKIGNRALFFIIKDNFSYKKLIWEFDDSIEAVGPSGKPIKSRKPKWIHISWSIDPTENNLKRVYRAVKVGNRTVYQNFSTTGL